MYKESCSKRSKICVLLGSSLCGGRREKKGKENINLLLKQMRTDFDARFSKLFTLSPFYCYGIKSQNVCLL